MDFLEKTFDPVTLAITVSLLPNVNAPKTVYNVSAVFDEPGLYEFSLGLILNVIDICDDSYFEAAPVLSPDD